MDNLIALIQTASELTVLALIISTFICMFLDLTEDIPTLLRCPQTNVCEAYNTENYDYWEVSIVEAVQRAQAPQSFTYQLCLPPAKQPVFQASEYAFIKKYSARSLTRISNKLVSLANPTSQQLINELIIKGISPREVRAVFSGRKAQITRS